MSTAPSGSVWASYLQQLCLVAVVSVSVDTLSEPGVKLLQWLHLGAIRLRHGSPQELLKNRNRFEAPAFRPVSSFYSLLAAGVGEGMLCDFLFVSGLKAALQPLVLQTEDVSRRLPPVRREQIPSCSAS